jgi:hypothetical protein
MLFFAAFETWCTRLTAKATVRDERPSYAVCRLSQAAAIPALNIIQSILLVYLTLNYSLSCNVLIFPCLVFSPQVLDALGSGGTTRGALKCAGFWLAVIAGVLCMVTGIIITTCVSRGKHPPPRCLKGTFPYQVHGPSVRGRDRASVAPADPPSLSA